jgi:hypothetical protein
MKLDDKIAIDMKNKPNMLKIFKKTNDIYDDITGIIYEKKIYASQKFLIGNSNKSNNLLDINLNEIEGINDFHAIICNKINIL